jgi:threonine/homoserine/homoserine lactone efflux protein
MSNLLPKLVIAGLGASVSPVAIILLITVMFRDHARRNSLLYLLGFALTLVAIGVVGVTLFNKAGSGGTSKLDAYIDIILGFVCLALIPLAIKRKPKPPEEAAGGDLKASRAFYRGVVAMLINSSTIVIYVAGVHEISKAELGIADAVLALVILTAITLVTLIIPIAIYFISPRRAQKVLNSMRTWLLGHSKVIGIGILIIFGVYLLTKGIINLV